LLSLLGPCRGILLFQNDPLVPPLLVGHIFVEQNVLLHAVYFCEQECFFRVVGVVGLVLCSPALSCVLPGALNGKELGLGFEVKWEQLVGFDVFVVYDCRSFRGGWA
jgi:hypothetical protein